MHNYTVYSASQASKTKRQKYLYVKDGRYIPDHIIEQRLDAAYEFGRQECVQLCDDIHKTLPRELRDMIYDFLVPPDVRHHVIEARDEYGRPRVSDNPLISNSFFDPRPRMPKEAKTRREVWKFSEYTGDTVGQEIAERWYHTGIFVISAEDDLFERFLTKDVWERGVTPLEAVRNIHFVIPHVLIDIGTTPQITANLMLLLDLQDSKTRIRIVLAGCPFEHPIHALRPQGDLLSRTIFHLFPVIQGLRTRGFRDMQVSMGYWLDVTKFFDLEPAVFDCLFNETSREYLSTPDHIQTMRGLLDETESDFKSQAR